LLQRGVTGYDLDTCWTDYLQSVVGKLFITVVATILLDNSGSAKTAWRRADLERLLAFCADHAAELAALYAGGKPPAAGPELAVCFACRDGERT
jgi:hypothetical protein